MTSISANSPYQQLQSRIISGVSSGKIKSSDQDALSSSLSDINSSLQASGLNGAAPGKATIDSLISKQVQSGKLTADQADELQQIFGDFAASGGGSATSQLSASSSLTDLLNSGSSQSSSTSSSNDAASILNKFLETLKESSVTGYSSTGATSSSLTPLLVNIST